MPDRNARRVLAAAGELIAWWAALGALWLVYVSTVDVLEVSAGAVAAGVGAWAARAGRRAVGRG
ncbi:hypothetical protein IAG44_36210 [Streptomyces roseirectus]|uniref:Uncharacterized protein n=1 Tax=Streptomyces roseirectus TaxID=2768066 RepID=A0A7H0INK6_9ACTN|nr:hypothetical protein [Streptomyces roseirectus]QNP74372.1 hypothetical protein IAG44_36210 [Streptomyces roseirectus]